jgi:phage FluMu protein Com
LVANANYWSSTEYNATNAFNFNFNNGNTNNNNKTNTYSVRAVRDFSTYQKCPRCKNFGHFITQERVASYWIDQRDSTKSSIDYAKFHEIDTMVFKDLTNSLTYSSYINVETKKAKFKVYVDGDSSEIWKFFNLAITNWKIKKNAS